MADHGTASFDTTVLAIGGLRDVPFGLDLWNGKIVRDHDMKGGTVALQPQEIVAAAIEDHLGGVVLAMDRVGGHQLAGQVQTLKQRPRRDDLAVALTGAKPLLADHRMGGRGKGRDHGQGRAFGGRVEGPPQRLAVDRHDAFASLPKAVTNRSKQVAKARGSSSRNTRLNVSWLGTPFSSRRNSRNRSSRSAAKSAKSEQCSAPHTDAVSAMVKTSSRSWRLALPVRGSVTSADRPAIPDGWDTNRDQPMRVSMISIVLRACCFATARPPACCRTLAGLPVADRTIPPMSTLPIPVDRACPWRQWTDCPWSAAMRQSGHLCPERRLATMLGFQPGNIGLVRFEFAECLDPRRKARAFG